ncbi:DUF1840 domain-containing protein [Azoarcus olearius]|uniref:DUF1840 domain-containing protein n=1 Tax=Azoarcus sp. (strain BH72) TaxID=418699 RepID=A1KBT1_AZOSB|nr:DUF1840 domain-containing protein [Azoarcus olearius]ANQ86833.1 hypothetical protein dqs_3816 [Azoarcus olearius]CAL96287.1 conserved hypothetical protein [Azoarcus olearius]
MLYTFKSDAAAEVLMLGDAARKLIAILGKDATDTQGIVTVEQLPDAISRLRAAIEEDRARNAGRNEDDEAADREAGRTGMAAPVSLAQRAWPLLDMLEQSQRAKVPVVWGV